MKCLLVALMPILTFTCNIKHSGLGTNFEAETIDLIGFDNKLTADLPELYDSVTIMPFKVKSPIGKIEKIFFSKGIIYVWDKSDEKVWGFKSNGDSLFCINKQGKGPGEYLWIEDVSVSGSGDVHILDVAQKTVFTYGTKGEFKNQKTFNFWLHGYCGVGGYGYLFSATPEQPSGNYIEVYENSKKIRSYFPSTHIWHFDKTEFIPSGDSVFFTRRFDDNIYCLKEGILNVAYDVNFGHDQSFMEKLREAKTIAENKNLLRTEKYVGDIFNLSVSDTHLAFNYFEPVKGLIVQTNFFYNKKTKKGLSFKSFGDSNKGQFKIGIPIASDGHYFYALINPWSLDEAQRQQLQSLINYPLNSNSNPLLGRFVIKI